MYGNGTNICTEMYKSMLYDTHNIAPTCFGHYFGLPQGRVLTL